MAVYTVLVRKDPDSDFGVEVPDLPGCFSAGETLSEALIEVHEAIYGHIEGMAKHGELPPAPSELSEEDTTDAIIAAVEIDLSKVSIETERVNVTLPRWLISAIDASEPNRSAFLAESAAAALQEKHRNSGSS